VQAVLQLDVQRFPNQSVPSLSKVAIRSAGGTKSALPGSVTAWRKVMIDCFAALSFQDGKGLFIVIFLSLV
jgi:hypothetical protein